MSVSPASNCGRILSLPSTSCFAPRPRGTSPASLYGLLTNPIGCEVNMLSPAPMLFQRAPSQETRQACALGDCGIEPLCRLHQSNSTALPLVAVQLDAALA